MRTARLMSPFAMPSDLTRRANAMPGSSFSFALTMIGCPPRVVWLRSSCHRQPERPSCQRILDDLQARKVLVDRFDFALQRVELFLLLGVEGFALFRSCVHDRLLAIGLHTAIGGEAAICSA
jgi:hypothetical protein